MDLTARGYERLLAITRWCRGSRRKLDDTEDLTHDAWIRAQSRNEPLDLSTPKGWAYFARICRSIQVDWARRVQRLEDVKEELASTGKSATEDPAPRWMRILDIHDALCEMHDSSVFGPRYSQIVEFRYFVGFNLEETAQAMGLSRRTVCTCWALAKSSLELRLRVVR